MRTCPNCGSLISDDEHPCGVCGSDISETASLGLDQSTQFKDHAARMKGEASKSGIAGLLIGLGLIVSGSASLFFIGLLGFAILIVGVVLVMSGIDTITGKPYRPLRGRASRAMNEEADREEAEERDRESGAAD